ncbi:MAG: hypothetical protein ACK55R_08510 [Cyanobacteriota bacterium]|jgi:hypothetical protein
MEGPKIQQVYRVDNAFFESEAEAQEYALMEQRKRQAVAIAEQTHEALAALLAAGTAPPVSERITSVLEALKQLEAAPDPSGAPVELLGQLGPDWRYAGSVTVDSAGLLVIDPFYDQPEPWAIDQARDRGSYGPVLLSPTPLRTAVHCQSGVGDGCYPVVVRVVDLPNRGERVAELRIVFDVPEDLPAA